MWEARCSCGNTTVVTPSLVKPGGTVSCGCYRSSRLRTHVRLHDPHNKKDWAGFKRGKLTFIKVTERRTRKGNEIWEVVCDCGNTHYITPGSAAKSCGCVGKVTRVAGGKKNRQYDPYIGNARAVWQRGYRDCDFDTFYRLSQEACDYCDRLPFRIANYRKTIGNVFTYNGLDRVDNARGHSPDNVVPCCADCNWMKGNRTREEFLTHIGRIYNKKNPM